MPTSEATRAPPKRYFPLVVGIIRESACSLICRARHIKESISIAVRNAAGKIVLECVIETKASMIQQFFDGLRGDLHVTFEEGTRFGNGRELSSVFELNWTTKCERNSKRS